MTVLSIVYFLILAILISLFFSFTLRVKGPWGSFWSFFLVTFLAVYAVDSWINPVGPVFRDIHWVPPAITGLAIGLLLAALTPAPTTREKMEKDRNHTKAGSYLRMPGVLFWILLLIMGMVIALGYTH